MHFSIPDTQDLSHDLVKSVVIGYNVHINGVFHCIVRFKQFHNLHEQLRREFGGDRLPVFPPKRFLPLTSVQLEERRISLEKYIQSVAQDRKLSKSSVFIGFLVSAQQESSHEQRRDVTVDVYTGKYNQVAVHMSTYDRTAQIMQKFAKHIQLRPEYEPYFSLFLVKTSNRLGREMVVVRKFLEYECPLLTQKYFGEATRIVVRRSYWDNEYDIELINDPIALNLLYLQCVGDVENCWIQCPNNEAKIELTALQMQLAKFEYLQLVRTFRYYGFMHFVCCICDFPLPQSRVSIAIGNQELSLRLHSSDQTVKEGIFKVSRMKCWRVTAVHNKENASTSASGRSSCNRGYPELSFEYLMAKDKLQWITITSEQATLMSLCLQSLVDELLVKKNDMNGYGRRSAANSYYNYMKRDGSRHNVSLNGLNSDDEGDHYRSCGNNATQPETFTIKRLQEKFSVVSFKNGRELIENHAFEGIGDEDL